MIKSTKIKPNSRKQNAFIFFGGLHFLVWLIMCFGFGWRGLLFGFLANCIMDAGVLLSWIWQEKLEKRSLRSPTPKAYSLHNNRKVYLFEIRVLNGNQTFL